MSRSLGKIDKKDLQEVFLRRTGAFSENVQQGPAFGVDTAIIQVGNGKGIVVASDPLSYIPALGLKESAFLSVILTANDVATSGFLPQYAQFILNLPHTMTASELEAYWEHIHYFCKEFGISITGGHTGFDNLGTSTLAGGGSMFAEVDLKQVKSSVYATVGQDIIQTKSAALSSSSILAMSFPDFTKKHIGEKAQQLLVNSFYEISVLQEVRALKKRLDLYDNIRAMHDVTEGGVLGAVYELCEASGVGVELYEQEIALGKEQKEICELFQIDPFRSVGAGSLLISCDSTRSMDVITHLKAENIEAKIIGQTKKRSEGKKIIESKQTRELVYEEEDPYWKAFFDAVEKNLN